MALTFLFDLPIAIDGQIGPETRDAARQLLVQRGLAQAQRITQPSALDKQLQAAQEGFAIAGSKGEKTPRQLLEDVYAVVEQALEEDSRRKPLETALTAFAEHEHTAAWLEQF